MLIILTLYLVLVWLVRRLLISGMPYAAEQIARPGFLQDYRRKNRGIWARYGRRLIHGDGAFCTAP